jgi:uncharacterized protein (DUF4415 family)
MQTIPGFHRLRPRAVYPQPKNLVSIRLDSVAQFLQGDRQGLTRINAVLRHFMQETLRNKKAG